MRARSVTYYCSLHTAVTGGRLNGQTDEHIAFVFQTFPFSHHCLHSEPSGSKGDPQSLSELPPVKKAAAADVTGKAAPEC